MKEILQRQKDEISLLKLKIKEEQETKLNQRHNAYVTKIK